MGLTLSPRLAAIAGCVPKNTNLADIGTDHGYLPVRLLLDHAIDRAIATDLRPGPLEHARETARHYGMEGQISFRLCDGLAGVEPDEVDAVVIAGMGGETIASILAAAPWTRDGKQLLLQPMTRLPELRGWLGEHGFCIEQEHIACEGKRLYSIMRVKGGESAPLTCLEQWAGKQSDDPLRGEWLEYVAAKVSRALNGQLSSKAPDRAKIDLLEQVFSGIREMRKEL